MAGVLAGIARHDRAKGPVETIDRARITLMGGIEGDVRGTAKPGSRRRRQVTLMTRAGWAAAMRDLGADLVWYERRVNLLIDGDELPRATGTRLMIGPVMLELTFECDPCFRMDQIAQGLCSALTPDWRGGICTRVLSGGEIQLGDAVTWEQA